MCIGEIKDFPLFQTQSTNARGILVKMEVFVMKMVLVCTHVNVLLASVEILVLMVNSKYVKTSFLYLLTL